ASGRRGKADRRHAAVRAAAGPRGRRGGGGRLLHGGPRRPACGAERSDHAASPRGRARDHRGRAGDSRGREAAVSFAAMSTLRRWIAIAVALYLLLVLLDRF